MRKIHNIRHLKEEQKSVELRKLQLEKELHRDWNDLKQYFTTNGISLFSVLTRQYAANLIVQGLSFGANKLTKKIGGKIGSKLFNRLK